MIMNELGIVPMYIQHANRDGQLFAKQYGDTIIRTYTDAQFGSAASWKEICDTAVAAFDVEAARLRDEHRMPEDAAREWLDAATGAFVQRTKTLHVIHRGATA